VDLPEIRAPTEEEEKTFEETVAKHIIQHRQPFNTIHINEKARPLMESNHQSECRCVEDRSTQSQLFQSQITSISQSKHTSFAASTSVYGMDWMYKQIDFDEDVQSILREISSREQLANQGISASLQF
jgi:hypothetical protein